MIRTIEIKDKTYEVNIGHRVYFKFLDAKGIMQKAADGGADDIGMGITDIMQLFADGINDAKRIQGVPAKDRKMTAEKAMDLLDDAPNGTFTKISELVTEELQLKSEGLTEGEDEDSEGK